MLIPPKYIELKEISINRDMFCLLFRTQDSLVGLMSEEGKILLPAKYKQIMTNYRNSPPYMFIFQDMNQKYGAINDEFKTVISAAYTHLEINFLLNDATPYFTFSRDGKKEIGLMDINEKVLIAPILSDISPLRKMYYDGNQGFQEPNLFIGGKNIDGKQKYALFSTKNFKQLTDFVFNTWVTTDTIFTYDPESFMETVAIAVSPMFYRYANLYSGNPAEALILRQGSKQTVYDKFGKMLVPPVWDSIRFVGDNPAFYFVSKNNKWGIIDAKNKLIIPTVYDTIYKHAQADLFFVGKAQADKRIKYALYNGKDKLCTDFIFNSGVMETVIMFDMETFEEYEVPAVRFPGDISNDNSVILLQNDKFVVYNLNGQPIIATPYQKINYLTPDIANSAFVVTNDKAQIAFFAPDGKPVSDFIYKSFDVNASSAVKLDGTIVKINEKGQEIK